MTTTAVISTFAKDLLIFDDRVVERQGYPAFFISSFLKNEGLTSDNICSENYAKESTNEFLRKKVKT